MAGFQTSWRRYGGSVTKIGNRGLLHEPVTAGLIYRGHAKTITVPAHAGAVQWCDPASSLFDARIYDDDSHGGGYVCDPYGPAYGADIGCQRR